MSGIASDRWFWNDWQGEPTLRICCMAAQGVWMRMLCLAADVSDEFGFVKIAGRGATKEDIAGVCGKPVDEIGPLVDELGINQVYSVDRRGIMYCRRMVRDAKKRKASQKGGKKGGRVTHSKQKGIFSTQDPTQGGTQGATQAQGARPLPVPVSKKEKTSLMRGGNGTGNGVGNGHYTVSDPNDRIARFQKKLAGALGSNGWLIVHAATNLDDPDHEKALATCQQAATTINKGWPLNWPAEHKGTPI